MIIKYVHQALIALGMAAVLSLGASAYQSRPAANPPQDKNPPAQEKKESGNVFKDGWITMKIHSQYIPEDALDGSNIDVDTTNGVVTLTGTVPTQAGHSRAVAIAKATDGVKSVTDKLRVAPSDTAKGAAHDTAHKTGRAVNDGWIKSKIYSQFLTDWKTFDDSDIDIDVATGVVTLKGTVKTDAAKTRAEAIAKATDGVKDVKNNLRVAAK
jgi:hyperosmotically inducible periplasmic protein